MSKIELDFGMALKEYRSRSGLSQEELAHESELDRTYISLLERNRKAPTLTTLMKIAEVLKVSPSNMLSFAEGKKSSEASSFSASKKKEKMRFPFMGTAVSCGQAVTEDYKIEKEISLEDLVIRHPQKTFFIHASGDSMAPNIMDGDMLVIELSNKAKNNDIVLVQIDNDFTVKRLVKTPKKTRLVPDNPLFKEIDLSSSDQVSICGIVISTFRSF